MDKALSLKQAIDEPLDTTRELDGERLANSAVSASAVEEVVYEWLEVMRKAEDQPVARDLKIESDDYKQMFGLVADLCQRVFPDLHKAVFGNGAGTMDLIFKDKWQEGCFKLFYYNPDSCAGGLIEECPFDVVDASEMIGNPNYMDVLAEHVHYLSDVNSEHFFERIFDLIEMKENGLYLGNDANSVCKQIEHNAKGLMDTLADAVRSVPSQGQGPSVKGQGKVLSNSLEFDNDLEVNSRYSLEEKLERAKEGSVRFVTDSVVGVGEFVEDGEMRRGLNDSFVLRNKTLDACYAIPGYEKLPREERNQLYDLVKKAIALDLGKDRDFGI